MDPDVTLARMRELVADLHAGGLNVQDDGTELAELVETLDSWLSKGGFLPAAWARPTPRDRRVEARQLLDKHIAKRFEAEDE